MAALWWALGIMLGIVALLLFAAASAVLIRWRLYACVDVDGLDVKLKAGIGAQRLSPLGYRAHIFRENGQWKYELTGPFDDKIKALIDEAMSGKKEIQREQAEKTLEELEKKEHPLLDEFLDCLMDNVHIEKYASTAKVGIKDDAMTCAMLCGTVNAALGMLSAILVSRFINDNAIEISTIPLFNENKLGIKLDTVVSIRAADAAGTMINKRRKKKARNKAYAASH